MWALWETRFIYFSTEEVCVFEITELDPKIIIITQQEENEKHMVIKDQIQAKLKEILEKMNPCPL